MSARRKHQTDRTSAFGGESADLEEVADEIYGAGVDPHLITGRIVGHPVPVMEIWADPRQPRRAIPAAFRGAWDGNPRMVWRILQAWHGWVEEEMARRGVDWKLDVHGLLNGTASTGDVDALDTPELVGFFDLLALAASIRREGLANPISITRVGERQYRIEAGERRWLAHHILTSIDARYIRIAAVQGAGDVWRQAAENGARKPLNAVGMARQIALLIMDLYPDGPWRRYEDCVDENGHDQEFYAQVGDGAEYPIPRGQLQRVLEVTGLKSRYQVSQYRALLRLLPELWLYGDAANSTEWALRHSLERPRTPQQEVSSPPEAREEGDYVQTPEERIQREYEVERPTPPALTDGDGSIPRHYHDKNPPGAIKGEAPPLEKVPLSRLYPGAEQVLHALAAHGYPSGGKDGLQMTILAQLSKEELQQIVQQRGPEWKEWLGAQWVFAWTVLYDAEKTLQELAAAMRDICEDAAGPE